MLKFCIAVLLVSMICSCSKDKLASVVFDSPFVEGNGEFIIVDSLYYPTNFTQPQFVRFRFHDSLGDTSLYHHINVYNGPILYQQLPRSQKDRFEFEYLGSGVTTYVFYFKLVDDIGRESIKSKNYIITVY